MVKWCHFHGNHNDDDHDNDEKNNDGDSHDSSARQKRWAIITDCSHTTLVIILTVLVLMKTNGETHKFLQPQKMTIV